MLNSHWVVCCSPAYIAKFGQPATIEELTQHNCLAYTYQDKGAYDLRFVRDGQDLSVHISGNFSTNNAQVLRQAALAGGGIVYVPKVSVHEDLQQGRLLPLLSDYQTRILGIYALYTYTRHQPAKVKLLIEYIAAAFEQRKEYF